MKKAAMNQSPNIPIDPPHSLGSVARQVTRKRLKKPMVVLVSFAIALLFLLVWLVINSVEDAASLTKNSAMLPVLKALEPSMEIKEADPQSFFPDLKDRRILLSPATRFITVKLKDSDTAEPVLSAEALLTIKPEDDAREGKPSAEKQDTGNEENDPVPSHLVFEDGDAYRAHGNPDDEGLLLLDVPHHLSGPGYMAITAPGYKRKAIPLSIPEETSLDLGAVYLEVEWSICGRVTDLAGNPIMGAEVMGEKRRNYIRKGELIKETIKHTKTTDAEGVFVFSSKDDPRDYWYPETIRAGAAGYATRFVDRVDEKPLPIVIPLDEGRTVRGRVVWSLDGSGIAGVPLMCQGQESQKTTVLETVTDEEGRFVLSGFPAQESTLGVHISRKRRSPDLVIDFPTDINDMGDIVVEGPVTVDVTVIEEGTNSPVQGAEMSSGVYRGFNFKSLFTDEYGRANVTGIPSGVGFAFSARAHGYYRDRNKTKKIITGRSGSHHSLELTLVKKPVTPEKFVVSGKVIDRRGCPVPNAEISLHSETRDHYRSNDKGHPEGFGIPLKFCQSVEMADESGAFEIPMEDSRWIRTIEVKHPRYAPFRADGVFLNETGDQEITVTLNDIEEWFYGRVRTDEDSPVNGASVEIQYRCVEGKENGSNPAKFHYWATSHSNGFFALPYLAGMKFSLQARKESEKSKPLTGSSETELMPGASCAELVLSTTTKDNLYMNFSCTRSSRAPLKNFFVASGGVNSYVKTDSRGEASWEHLQNRTYCVSIYGKHRVIGIYGVGINPTPEKDLYYSFELIPGRFVELKATLSFNGKLSEQQADSMELKFEELNEDQWESPAIRIENDDGIVWTRSIFKNVVYINAETGDPVVSFMTYLYEGSFRLKLSAPGFQKVLSEPFVIIDHPDALHLNFTLYSL